MTVTVMHAEQGEGGIGERCGIYQGCRAFYQQRTQVWRQVPLQKSCMHEIHELSPSEIQTRQFERSCWPSYRTSFPNPSARNGVVVIILHSQPVTGYFSIMLGPHTSATVSGHIIVQVCSICLINARYVSQFTRSGRNCDPMRWSPPVIPAQTLIDKRR